MDEDQKIRYKLRKLVRELARHRARHTELISVYIPAGYNAQLIIDQLSTEAGTARNIKSASTRKNVTGALEKMLQHLRLYKKTPEHGLAIFSGNISEREGAQDFQVWALEPPVELRVKLYKCDQAFFLEPLTEQLETKSTYGLVVMDRREANIALLEGKTIIPVREDTSFVPGKFKVGGQSAGRMARVVEGEAKNWYRKVGEMINQTFSNKPGIIGIIIGGPGPTKEDLVSGDFIAGDVKKKILGVKHIGYTGEFGLKELVEKSEDILAKEEVIREKQAVDSFLGMLATRPSFTAYGEAEVKKALEAKAVSMLLLSENLPDKLLDELVELGEEVGADVRLISKDTKEGQQLIGIGSVAAVLRYAL